MLPKINSLALVCLLLALSANTLLAQVVATAGVNQNICAGGTVTIGGSPTATGGTSPYTYAWAPIAYLSSANVANPVADPVVTTTYTVTVTDANSLTATASVTVTVNPAPQIDSLFITNISCHDSSTGSICVYASGGGSVAYAWSNTATTQCISHLSSNAYSVTITNSFGCTTIIDTVVRQSAQLVVSFTDGNIACNGVGDGSISTTVTGGTPPYEYIWSNGQSNTPTIQSLHAGIYGLTIIDANACTITNSTALTQPSALTVSPTITNVSCFGGSNGSACETVNGGTPPYTYAWSNGATTACAGSFLSAGTYNVTITDANSCSATSSAGVAQPAALHDSISVTGVTCFGGSNGSLCENITGGTPPYNYLWSNSVTTLCMSNNLTAGNYTTTVTDANGCSVSAAATVTQPVAPLLDSLTITNIGCNGASNGTISEQVYNGISAYTFHWSNGENTSTATSLSAGTYSVTVTDALGCTATASGTVTQPPVLNLQISTSGTTVLPDTARLHVTGGVEPYRINWGNGQNSYTDSTASFIYNTKGVYGITIIDTENCFMVYTLYVDTTTPLVAKAGNNTTICLNNSIVLGGSPTASGGRAPYSYVWSGGAAGIANPTVTPTATQTYTVTVTDANSASATSSITITVGPALTAYFSSPSGCPGGPVTFTDQSIPSAGITGWAWNFGDGNTSNVENPTNSFAAAGIYPVTLTVTNNFCSADTTINVTVNQVPTASFSATSPVCEGQNSGITYTGSASVNAIYTWNFNGGIIASGTGAGPYQVSWGTGGTQLVTLSVTDNGCSSTITSETVTVNPLPGLTITPDTFVCGGGNITLMVSGAIAYSWSPSNGLNSTSLPTVVASPASTTTYTVTGFTSGCSSTTSVTVNVSNLNLSSQTVTNLTCYGSSTGGICPVVTGGVAPYSFSWSDGETAQCISNLSTGFYTLTIVDSHGCSFFDSATVLSPTQLAINDSITNLNCSGNSTGAISVTATGGTPGYTFLWSNSATTQNISNLGIGTYITTVVDANNCSTTASFSLTQPANTVLVDSFITTPVSCYNDSSGRICAVVSGGTAPYSYLWRYYYPVDSTSGINNTSGACLSSVSGGQFWAIVTDANGCSDSAYLALNQPTQLTLQVLTPDTNAVPDTVTFTVTGGTPPYLYNWGDGQTTSTGQYVYTTGGVYLDTISDAKGCVLTYLVDAGCTDQCVWPGDANYDGVVNNQDLLAIGVGYDTTGPARANPTINFIPQYCAAWADTLVGGVNYKHVDCNGDGIINAADTSAIVLNYSLTHVRGSSSSTWKADAPGLYITTSSDTVGDGEILTSTLSLGNQSLPVTNAYAVAFTYNFDPLVVDTTDVSLTFGNSWLFGPGNHINITKNFYPEGQIQAAITRINHISLTGSGPIAEVSMKITTGNINGKNLQYYVMNNFISNLTVIDNFGNVLAVNEGTDSVQVGYTPTSVLKVKNSNTQIQIFPNPASDQLNILSSQSDIEEITIFDLAGQQVIHQNMQAGNYSVINVSNLSDGVYLIKLKTEGQYYHSRFVKTGAK